MHVEPPGLIQSLQEHRFPNRTSSSRAEMVITNPYEGEWTNHQTQAPRYDDIHQCLNVGVGSHIGECEDWGAWNNKEFTLHINCLELLAAWYMTQAFVQLRTYLTVLLWLVNRLVVAYINHMGGTHSSNLADLAIQFWSWTLERAIFLVAKNIAGKDNIPADRMSRSR